LHVAARNVIFIEAPREAGTGQELFLQMKATRRLAAWGYPICLEKDMDIRSPAPAQAAGNALAGRFDAACR